MNLPRTPSPPTPPADSSSHADDARALRALVLRLFDCWNRADAWAYAALFTEDSDYVAFDGTHLRGRQANARLHQALFAGFFLRGSVLEGEVESIRFPAPGVAILHVSGGVRLRWQSRARADRRSRQTLVALQEDGAWAFTAFHNARIQKPPRLARWLERLAGGASRAARPLTSDARPSASPPSAGPA